MEQSSVEHKWGAGGGGTVTRKRTRGATPSPRLPLLPEIWLFPRLQKMCTRGPSRWMERIPHSWSWTPGRLRNG